MTLLSFLRWYFSLQRVSVEDLSVELTNHELGETSAADLSEGLGIIADEVDRAMLPLVRDAQAMVDAAVMSASAAQGVSVYELSVDDIATTMSATGADLGAVMGVDVASDTEAESTASEGLPPLPTVEPPGTATPSDDAPSPPTTDAAETAPATPQPSAPSAPAPGDHQPPTHEPPTDETPPPHHPPPDERPPHDPQPHDPLPPENGIPDFGGYEVVREGDTYYARIGDEFVEVMMLEPAGWVAEYGEFVVADRPDDGVPGLVWENAPGGQPLELAALVDEGVRLEFEDDVAIEITGGQILLDVPNGSINLARTQYSFEGLWENRAPIIRSAEEPYDLIYDPEDPDVLDRETGEVYDTVDDWLAAQEPVADAEPPPSWLGHEVLDDGDGPYVELDGFTVELVMDAPGEWVGRHAGHTLGDDPDDAIDGLTWLDTPNGEPLSVDALRTGGLRLEMDPGEYLTIRSSGYNYDHPDLGLATIPNSYDFLGVFDGQAVFRSGELDILYGDGNQQWRDNVTGITYDDIDDYIAAQQAEAEAEADYPDAWGGAAVQVDDDGPHVEIDGNRLDLVDDGQGGYVAEHEGYSLGESATGALVWTNAPDGGQHQVTGLLDDGIRIDLGPTSYATFTGETFRYAFNVSDQGQSALTFSPPIEFVGFHEDGVIIRHPDFDTDWVYADNMTYWRDRETGELYESQEAWEEAQDGDDDGEIDTIDAVPATFGGHEIDSDGAGQFVVIDGWRVDLVDDGAGGLSGTHGGFELAEDGAGQLVWTSTPTGAYYEVRTLTADGIEIAHPTGDYVRINADRTFTFEDADDDGAIENLHFGAPFRFYDLLADGVRAIHEEEGYFVRYDETATIRYQDIDTGEIYETVQELEAAREGTDGDDDMSGTVGSDDLDEGDPDITADQITGEGGSDDLVTADEGSGSGDNGNVLGDGGPSNTGNLEGGDEQEPDPDLFPFFENPLIGDETDDAPPPPPDSIGYGQGAGGPVLAIVHGGVEHAVPVSVDAGGYFVRIGGVDYEVHVEGGTYFVVAGGQAYDLHGDPSAAGWPFDHPAAGIDASAYEPPPPPPPPPAPSPDEDEAGDALGADDGSTPMVDAESQSDPGSSEPGVEETLPPADPEDAGSAVETGAADDTLPEGE